MTVLIMMVRLFWCPSDGFSVYSVMCLPFACRFVLVVMGAWLTSRMISCRSYGCSDSEVDCVVPVSGAGSVLAIRCECTMVSQCFLYIQDTHGHRWSS